MREIFVESELEQFPCPTGFSALGGTTSVGEPVQGGRARAKPLFIHRLNAPDELTQETLFVFRNWKSRRCYPDPVRPQSPLWWVVEGDPDHYVVVDGERRKAELAQIPAPRLFDLPAEAVLSVPVFSAPEAVLSLPEFGGQAEALSSPERGEPETAFALVPLALPGPDPDLVIAERPQWLAETAAAEEETFPTIEAVAAEESVPSAEALPTPYSVEADDEAPSAVAVAEPSFPSETRVPVHVDIEEAPASTGRASEPAVAVSVERPDPFRRSLDAVLAELTAPISVEPERQARVAVRVVTPSEGGTDGPVSLPSRPELISSDFLSSPEAARPALAPIDTRSPRTTFRLPPRAFAVAAGVLVLFTLAFWLFH